LKPNINGYYLIETYFLLNDFAEEKINVSLHFLFLFVFQKLVANKSEKKSMSFSHLVLND
jgi:hypothetical protein